MRAADPVREPKLERAVPADAVPGSTLSEDTEAEVVLQDGSRVWCQVIGQRRDRQGRWCASVSAGTPPRRSAAGKAGSCSISATSAGRTA